jgi:hypothetical protein
MNVTPPDLLASSFPNARQPLSLVLGAVFSLHGRIPSELDTLLKRIECGVGRFHDDVSGEPPMVM